MVIKTGLYTASISSVTVTDSDGHPNLAMDIHVFNIILLLILLL